jgi:hypothetical protein
LRAAIVKNGGVRTCGLLRKGLIVMEAINVILIIFYLAVVIYLVVLVTRFVSAHEKIANNIAEYLRRSGQS